MKRQFVLLCLCSLILSQAEVPKCKKEIIESYNLNSYITPRLQNFFLCPELRDSCCSMYDQFLMFSSWKDRVKPKMIRYYDAIRVKYTQLRSNVDGFMKLNIKKAIQNLSIPDELKETTMSKFVLINSQNFTDIIDETLILFKNAY